MYNQPYFIPGYFSSPNPMMMRGAMSGIGSMGRNMGNMLNGAGLATQGASRGLGLFGRLGNSMRAIKGINWGGLITNASKTLNVVNQAIPLVRQVGPMVNNMKSMLRIASVFKDETDKKPDKKANQTTTNKINNHKNNYNQNTSNNTVNSQNRSNAIDIKEQDDYRNFEHYDNSPTFFVNS